MFVTAPNILLISVSKCLSASAATSILFPTHPIPPPLLFYFAGCVLSVVVWWSLACYDPILPRPPSVVFFAVNNSNNNAASSSLPQQQRQQPLQQQLDEYSRYINSVQCTVHNTVQYAMLWRWRPHRTVKSLWLKSRSIAVRAIIPPSSPHLSPPTPPAFSFGLLLLLSSPSPKKNKKTPAAEK